jgi:hypothetical protein
MTLILGIKGLFGHSKGGVAGQGHQGTPEKSATPTVAAFATYSAVMEISTQVRAIENAYVNSGQQGALGTFRWWSLD